MNEEIFKAYDVRGIYPTDINEEIAYKIGFSAVKELGAKKIAVGRDARPHGKSLMKEMIQGIRDAGCDVINLDMITTPMLYFASWNLDVDGAISVTASHNPIEYNGVKICRKNAVPVGLESGFNNIKNDVLNFKATSVDNIGNIQSYDIKDEYYEYVTKFANFGSKKFNIVIDCANTMGVLDLPIYKKFSDNINVTELYCNLNNPYTAHEANPANTSTLDELREKVIETGASIGIAYDGDADRIGFVDEKGDIIPMDLITGFIAEALLKETPRSTILYDLRSSMSVKELIEEKGGKAKECRVGGPFIKPEMLKEDAIFAGEFSGHYYFKINKGGELPAYVTFILLNLMSETGKNISELVSTLRKYNHSGEINSKVKDSTKILNKLKEVYSNGEFSELDGVKIIFWNNNSNEKWWFSVRSSNTEPVIRLNLEANSKELMNEKLDEILNIIRN